MSPAATITEAQIPSYHGRQVSAFDLSRLTRARDPRASRSWSKLPHPVGEWLRIQQWRSVLPEPGQLLVETFPRGSREYLVCYPFEGRLAHQTLGMLLTRRLERMRMRPLGFTANEYALAIWGLRDMGGVDMDLFDEDMLGDDLDAWLAESALYKRTFRNCAIIAGLIERRHPGREKTGRQVTFSSDLIYDVLRAHEPDHILLRATYEDAGTGLLDIARLAHAETHQGAHRDQNAWSGSRRWLCRRFWRSAGKWWRARRMRISCTRRRTIW
jgi:ATP-dependent Lhr-like helicase